MSAPRFVVEAVRGNVGVLVSTEVFASKFILAAQQNNLELSIYTPKDFNAINSSNLPQHDSWLIFLNQELATFIIGSGRGVWSALTTYPHPHLYLVEHSWNQLPLELPTHSTHILLGEYLGLDGEGSPTLEDLARSLEEGKHLVLGEGGLTNLHLMSENYVITGLLRVLASQTKTPKLNLGNINGVSLASLLQFYAEKENLPLKLAYQDGGITSPVPASFYRSTHVLFENLPKESTLDLFFSYLRSQKNKQKIKTTSQSQTIPLPSSPLSQQITSPPQKETASRPPTNRLPKLVRENAPKEPLTKTYNFSNLEFVPNKTPRKKLKLTYPRFLKNRTLKIAGRGLVFGLIFYLGSLALAWGITWATINNYKNQILGGTLENISSNQIAKFAATYLYTNAIALGAKEPALLLDAYQQTLEIGDTTSNLARNVKDISTYILGGGDVNLAGTLTTARLDVENLYQQLSLLDGTLPVDTPKLLSKYESDYQALKNLLPTLKKNTLLGKGVFSILPDLISLNDRTKYLVLFQNNMELRGTGGFIGSYGILSFEKGKLYDFQVYDVYTADGALKGHVEPPAPIKNILGEAKWYLRDSNFDPDFPTSARRAEWFLKKSMNQDVIGTIAINLETLRLMLREVGPLELSDYGETITENNLAERAQFHAEVNFFPGSTAKKEFLSSVADALFAKLKTADAKSLLNVANALMTSLESSDTQISVTSTSSERILQTLGWNGAIESKPCPTIPCYEDSLYSVDSNFGVNKANFYVTKEMNLDVSLSKDGTPTHTLQTTWKNAATSNAWPAGSYKNYARLYLPPSSSIQQVKVGDKLLSSTEYTISEEHGRLVLSYLITVPINNTSTSTVVYTNNTRLVSGAFYTLYFHRQSGSSTNDKIRVSYNLPLYLKPLKISPAPTLLETQKLSFDFLNDTDHRLSIQF
ncbi:MAG: hypothetical protein Fur0011_1590 [Candidatus Microgenomates bacterium]